MVEHKRKNLYECDSESDGSTAQKREIEILSKKYDDMEKINYQLLELHLNKKVN